MSFMSLANRAATITFAVVWMTAASTALAQIPDFSGTWRLDSGRSRVDAEATLAGLAGTGAPETLHVTQPSNGTLVVESQVNESHARIYVPDGESSTPVYLGELGTITMTSRWESGALVSAGTRTSGTTPSVTTSKVTEEFRVSTDGQTLEIRVTVAPDSESAARESSLRYTRIDDVGTCDSWPSPCKQRPR